MESLANNLFALRKTKGISREAVSRALEISAKSYERYEKNEREPNASLLVQLAEYYGVTLDQLVGREPLPEDPDKGA